jgi:hypothetical protein
MIAGGYEIIWMVAGFVLAAAWGGIRNRHRCKHQWGKWSDPLTLETQTSFRASRKVYQVRVCAACNESESRDVAEVRT